MLFTDISSDRAIRAFQKVGFTIVRDKGPHVVMTRGDDIIVIPRHKRINPYTLRATIKDAGLSDEEFRELL
jgi:predicted RNA binding protein YcfA (HicA-like mRNA interferase family)